MKYEYWKFQIETPLFAVQVEENYIYLRLCRWEYERG